MQVWTMLNATKQQSNKATFSVSPPLLKIAPIRAEFAPLSIGEICADELFFVPLHCESSLHEQVFEGPQTSIRSEANKDSIAPTKLRDTPPANVSSCPLPLYSPLIKNKNIYQKVQIFKRIA